MGLLYKPLKIIIFGFAIFGLLQIPYKDKKIIQYIHEWISAQKSAFENGGKSVSLGDFKSKAVDSLEKSKNKLVKELSKMELDTRDLFSDTKKQASAAIQSDEKAYSALGSSVSLVPGTQIPKTEAMNDRTQKVIQKLNIENEVISGSDKQTLENLFSE
jgi:Skp family chaperone for outer membrane proteins